ncbi:MAG TPA: hypothetical protein VLE69_01745 [Candidatus Saccharimonadales bacterium]|nr:hypothetical protein [Candidatus Saccharimonadales bacterium]
MAILCPQTGEVCPALARQESLKDQNTEIKIPAPESWGWEGFEFTAQQMPYEAQELISQTAQLAEWAGVCVENSNKTVCGVMVAIGLEN